MIKLFFSDLKKYRYLMMELVKKDIKLKYRNSYLGIIWTLLEPLLTMVVLTVVFSHLLGKGTKDFPVYILTGRLLYSYFSNATKAALTSIRKNGAMIKKVYVPKYMYPLSGVLSNYVMFLISLVVLAGVAVFRGVYPTKYLLLGIEKKYINEFIAKIHICGKYSAKSEEYKIIRRSMSINSIVLPKERIKSDKKGMAVAMDMLNELKRCPRELFETLSFSDQCRFRIISSDYNEVLQMRSTDRFVQLALQYIDYNRLFNNIRFHVNMGKLRYLFSPDKRCIDGQERVRVIEHPLNGYGRIDEMEKYRKNENGNYGNSNIHIRDFENVKRDDSDRNNYPYVVDTYTHYLLNNNKIEFCFCNDKITPKTESEAGKWYAVKEKPACRMSTFELPAMMFHLLLLGSERTEQRIAEVYNKYIKLFSALCEGTLTKENIDNFGIARADIPQKVLDSINNVTKGKSYKAHIKKTLITLLDETKKLLNRIKELYYQRTTKWANVVSNRYQLENLQHSWPMIL